MQYSAGKPGILPLMWMPLDKNPFAKTPLQIKHTPMVSTLMIGSSAGQCVLPHEQPEELKASTWP